MSTTGDPFAGPALEGVGFLRRASARVLDLAVHSAVTLAAGFACGIVIVVVAVLFRASSAALLQRVSPTPIQGYLAALAGSFWMHACAEGLHGSTLGKRICGITVIREDGGPAGLTAALRRTIAFYLDSLFFGVVAWHKMKESPRNQRIGDVWAGTMVVTIASLPEPRRRSTLRFLGVTALAIFGNAAVVSLELLSRVFLA